VRRLFLLHCVLFSAACPLFPQEPEEPGIAELVLINGKVWTVNPAQQLAEAVACLRGRVAAVGTTAEVRKWIGAGTQVIDLEGKLVLPGFIDAHVHLAQGGAALAGLQLRETRNENQFRDRIRDFASKLPSGRWISNGNWDHENWRPSRLPTRELIDPVTREHPVFLRRIDGHVALANSVALKMAGITRATPDPTGGVIERDAKGEPTGVLRDAAMDAVSRVIPPPAREETEAAIRLALRHAAENGVTSVHDMSSSVSDLAFYRRLEDADELTLRIYGHQPLAEWRRLSRVALHAGFGGEKLKLGGLKAFADGSLGASTALFFEPYKDSPGNSGLLSGEMTPENGVLTNLVGADRASLQVAMHAIGEKANDTVLNLFARVARASRARDRRFRIEHAQHLRPEDVPRFRRQGLIASMQPYHLIDDGRWAEKRLGPERVKNSYVFRSLLDAGTTLAFGSDWPVAPLNPLMGIYAAVTRRTLDDKNPRGWIPEQKITVGEAIQAYTYGSAYAAFEERMKGTIEVGKFADLVVLSRDILSIPPQDIAKTRIAITIFNGKKIF
jgi:predicted amidohydrolase YtcJ